MAPQGASRVSVDVLALRFNTAEKILEIATQYRSLPPYKGDLALPGVTLLEGERLKDAAVRALSEKLNIHKHLALGQIEVFDEPHRDPRGATLSVAMWSVTNGIAQWFPITDIPELAFDHKKIIEKSLPLLATKLWQDDSFTRALTGTEFPISTAIGLIKSLTGQNPDRGNLNRKLANLPGLTTSKKKISLGRGRPGTIWYWTN